MTVIFINVFYVFIFEKYIQGTRVHAEDVMIMTKFYQLKVTNYVAKTT